VAEVVVVVGKVVSAVVPVDVVSVVVPVEVVSVVVPVDVVSVVVSVVVPVGAVSVVVPVEVVSVVVPVGAVLDVVPVEVVSVVVVRVHFEALPFQLGDIQRGYLWANAEAFDTRSMIATPAEMIRSVWFFVRAVPIVDR
jgi:hypothetical protein